MIIHSVYKIPVAFSMCYNARILPLIPIPSMQDYSAGVSVSIGLHYEHRSAIMRSSFLVLVSAFPSDLAELVCVVPFCLYLFCLGHPYLRLLA